jgi:hypothetical protein
VQLLKEGNQEVVWIDSDVIVTGNISSRFEGMDRGVFVVTEEGLEKHNEIDALRARLWGFTVRRKVPFPLNTA